MPIAAEGQLAEAAAQCDQYSFSDAQPRRHTASLSLSVQMQLEYVAGDAKPSVARTVARCFLVAAFAVPPALPATYSRPSGTCAPRSRYG